MNRCFNPSLMCMDLLDIKNQTEILNERCHLDHVDIMDGHFVKNITLSPDFVKAFSKSPKSLLTAILWSPIRMIILKF